MVSHAASLGGRRRAVAKGSVINSVFLVGLGALNVVKALVAAAFLSQSEFGVWIILLLGVGTLVGLKAAAVSDKYIQQDEQDQELAFQKAFTLEIIAAGVMMLLALLLAPLLALLYGEPGLIAPMAVLSFMLPGLAAQAPIWIFYRRMDFLRQRVLLSIDAVVSFVITAALAVAGLGYWSLVIGAVAGAWTGGLVALIVSPFRLRFRYDSATTHRYMTFSWPLMAAVGSGLLIGHVAMFVGNAAIGLAATGAIGIAAILGQWADRVDSIVTQAMYPAICRVARDRPLLQEAFEKSNRIALMWAVPFGVALTLFASDFVSTVLGSNWESATILIQTFGITAAINHIGFNWGAFYRAVGRTRPIAVVTFVALLSFLAIPAPLIFIAGLEGFAIGMGAMTLVTLLVRGYYVLKLFPGFPVVGYACRAMLPVAPVVLLILAFRLWFDTVERTGLVALGELVAFVSIVAMLTFMLERPLMRELRGYLGRPHPIETRLV